MAVNSVRFVGDSEGALVECEGVFVGDNVAVVGVVAVAASADAASVGIRRLLSRRQHVNGQTVRQCAFSSAPGAWQWWSKE